MRLNLLSLKRVELDKRLRFKCEAHRHNGITHPGCYERSKGLIDKIGFLDIETSNLSADFGIILSYCIKEEDGKIIKRVLTKEEITGGVYDKNLLKQFCKDVMGFTRLVTYYGCVTRGHKILTASLEWKNVEDIVVGEKLLGFDEKGPKRHFKTSYVIHNTPIKKEVYTITLNNGEQLTATGDHKWLVQRGGFWLWKTTKQLLHFNGKNKLQRILPIWNTHLSYAAGYLLGLVRLQKLFMQFNPDKLGQVRIYESIQIESIVSSGIQEVMGLGTTTQTYIINGFGSHNTRFDIPYLRTRCILHKINFPVYKTIKHTDAYLIVKYKLNLHSRRLGVVAPFFNIPAKEHPLNPTVWIRCLGGNKKALAFVLKHNEEDVRSLEMLWKKIHNYTKIGDTSI